MQNFSVKKYKVHLISFTIKPISPIDTLHQFPRMNQVNA